MKQPGKAVVWPVNIDSARTLGQGRKIPRGLCVNSPKLQELSSAAESLGLRFEVVKGSSRPCSWWEKAGHLVVERSEMSKRTLLTHLAEEVKRLRATMA